MSDEALEKEKEIESEANENGAAEAVAEERELTVEEQLAAALAKSAENLEGWQRARAEFANARKRFDQQKGASRTNALVEIAEQLLPIIDDFDLAFANVPEEIAGTEWFGGLELIPRKFTNILEKINIERIFAVGQQFDPNLHQAIMREPSDDYATDTIIKEFQAGYKIGDRVVRPSVVAVAE